MLIIKNKSKQIVIRNHLGLLVISVTTLYPEYVLRCDCIDFAESHKSCISARTAYFLLTFEKQNTH